jgi:gliding motility-associated-like protein
MLAGFNSEAFHIVGGELEFITVGPGRYIINLIQYFDEAQDENPGPEPSAEVYIFSNRDNALVSIHQLALLGIEPVEYTKPECAIDQLVTSRIVWSTDTLELDPEQYADIEGYYLVWERCCRNSAIKNIEAPSSTGMKYVLEIPPLWKDGEPFINSSPILFKPLSDYACVGQLYYIEFTGVDPDGDSLVYSLTEPLNTIAVEAVPIPQPKPHIVKNYRPGFESIIPGNPSLQISQKGLLTVNPAEVGFYVFSVLVEEYRGRRKIGETRRDFQMLVVDGCLPPDPPVVGYQIPGRPGFNPQQDTLRYQVADEKRFSLLVSNITNGETISLRAEGVNFDGRIDDIFEFETVPVGEGQDTIQLNVTLPSCPPVRDEPVILDIIAGDDACPLPQLDTLRLTFVIEPPPNQFPVGQLDAQNVVVNEDDIFINSLFSTDVDRDSIDVSLFLKDSQLEPGDIGLELIDLQQSRGETRTAIKWDTDCTIYDFSEQTDFTLGILLEDLDSCLVPNKDTILLDYSVVLPPNTPPRVSLEGIDQNVISAIPQEIIRFDVTIEDDDNDEVSVVLLDAEELKVDLQSEFDEATGIGSAKGQFRWEIPCETLVEDSLNEFSFTFVGDDFDKCKVKNFDTLQVKVEVDVPFNNAPRLQRYDRYELEVNVPFSLDILATDEDLDTIFLDFAPGSERPDSESLNFQPTFGRGEVRQTLTWTPDCALLRNGEPTLYDLTFVTFDERCPVAKLDTTRISFIIKETRELFNNFQPANAFSPNGDGKNDLFTMTGLVPPEQQLPPDNCEDIFQYISIHNRAGQRIYYSESRDFSWDGADLPAGTYYYVLKYSKTEFRNFVTLLR